MCIMDGITSFLTIILTFTRYRELHVAFSLINIGTSECYLGAYIEEI